MNENTNNLFDSSLMHSELNAAINQRGTHGYCDFDLMDFDTYLINVIYFGLKQYLTNAEEIAEMPEQTKDKIHEICYHIKEARAIEDNFEGKDIEKMFNEMNYHNKIAFSILADILPTLWY